MFDIFNMLQYYIYDIYFTLYPSKFWENSFRLTKIFAFLTTRFLYLLFAVYGSFGFTSYFANHNQWSWRILIDVVHGMAG